MANNFKREIKIKSEEQKNFQEQKVRERGLKKKKTRGKKVKNYLGH